MSNDKTSKRKVKKPNLEICDKCPNNKCDTCPTYIRLIDALGCD